MERINCICGLLEELFPQWNEYMTELAVQKHCIRRRTEGKNSRSIETLFPLSMTE